MFTIKLKPLFFAKELIAIFKRCRAWTKCFYCYHITINSGNSDIIISFCFQVSNNCDQYNKLKNITSKAIGKKMKAKEPQGDTNEISDEAKNNIL